jgi:N-acetylglucosaminyldiphosphoundecaprenol N-acetyl-beta-D-mannosaminyltransferase
MHEDHALKEKAPPEAPPVQRLVWPMSLNVIGVPVSLTTYDEAMECIMSAVARGDPALVTALAVHGIVVASHDEVFRRRIAEFHIVAPDGQPVRHALNLLYKTGLRDRVCGPELMRRLCREAARRNVSIYLYGSTPTTVTRLRERLVARIPGLRVAGWEPSVFRALSDAEDRDLVERINGSGARLVFIGLGCPLQETFAHVHYPAIRAVQVCVGAAFDFLSDMKRMAPAWMQAHALEWLFRLAQEPRRLAYRYTVQNSQFVTRLLSQTVRMRYRSWTTFKGGHS